MFRRASVLRRMSVAAAVAATTLALLPTAPAAAAPPPECPFTDTLCLFEGTNFTGARFNVKALVPNGTCVDLVSHGWGGGRAHSAINTNSHAAQLHPVSSCYGYPMLVPGNSSLPSINFNASSVFVF
jgi:hypothetical protein